MRTRCGICVHGGEWDDENSNQGFSFRNVEFDLSIDTQIGSETY